MARRFGETEVVIDTAGDKELLSLKEYFSRFEDYRRKQAVAVPGQVPPAAPYLRTWYFSDQLPELVGEFTTPPHFADDAFRRLQPDMVPPFQWLFFGPKGTGPPAALLRPSHLLSLMQALAPTRAGSTHPGLKRLAASLLAESRLHVDVWETDAWLGNLQGQKLFTLFHPSMRPCAQRGAPRTPFNSVHAH